MVRVVIEHRAKDKEHMRHLVEAIKETRDEASKQPGFIKGETLLDTDDSCHVIVISSWKSKDDWQNWDRSETRQNLKKNIEKNLEIPYTVITLAADIIWNESLQHDFGTAG